MHDLGWPHHRDRRRMFEASIDRHEYIESSFEQGQQAVIRKGVPVEIESCCDVVVWKEFGDSWVNTGV
jgi:hypothetical protein